MGKSKYYYNPETCQYERARISFWKIFWYIIGVAVVGCFMLAGIVMITDRLFESAKEKALRAENNALRKHQVVLASQLETVESTLSQLQEKDISIYEKLFDEKARKNNTENIKTDKAQILSAEASDFMDELKSLADQTSHLYSNSVAINTAFGDHFELKPEDAAMLKTIPTLRPLAETDPELLLSGFGVRINPFHKGRYMHPGIDLAAPRGTQVFATAPGVVVNVNHSTVQAGYGNYIDIDHQNGFVTRYAHLEDITVRQGQHVTKGMSIATVGNSGGSIAPHLHYEIIQHGENVDPLIFMIEGLTSQQYTQLVSVSKQQNQSLD